MTTPLPTDDDTIRTGKEYILDNIGNGGVHCPCCTRLVKPYPRSVHAGKVQALIRMATAVNKQLAQGGDEFILTREVWRGCHDAAELRWVGVIEAKEIRTDGGRGGYWRITELGWQFLRGKVSITKKVWVVLGVVEHADNEQVWITDVIPGFRFDETMDEQP